MAESLRSKLQSLTDQLHLEFDATDGASNHASNLRISETLEFPEDNSAEVFGETMEKALKLLDHDQLLFGAWLSPVDMFKHPVREERFTRHMMIWIGSLATNVATRRHVAIGRIDDLAHGNSHQELPEFLPARRRSLAFELTGAEADIHTLENVLLVLSPTNSIIQVASHERLQSSRETLPDDPSRLVPLAAVG